MFSEPFPTVRPPWLQTTTQPKKGARLELDGYSKRLGIAFEYQGVQHYQDIPIWNAGGGLKGQLARDALKQRRCEDHKVVLVLVHQFANLDDLPGCISQIETAVRLAGLKIPDDWISPSELIAAKSSLERVLGSQQVADLLRIAQERGGELLSTQISRAQSRLRWRYSAGHEWLATAYAIRCNGNWCKICAGLAKKSMADMHAMASERGGECLSLEYLDADSKLRWRCSDGHEWLATPGSVRVESWCGKCAAARTRNDLSDMVKLAAAHGGEFLSSKYLLITRKSQPVSGGDRALAWFGRRPSQAGNHGCKIVSSVEDPMGK